MEISPPPTKKMKKRKKKNLPHAVKTRNAQLHSELTVAPPPLGRRPGIAVQREGVGSVAGSSRALQIPSEHEVLLQRRDARAADAQPLGDLCSLKSVQAEPTRSKTLSSTRSPG